MAELPDNLPPPALGAVLMFLPCPSRKAAKVVVQGKPSLSVLCHVQGITRLAQQCSLPGLCGERCCFYSNQNHVRNLFGKSVCQFLSSRSGTRSRGLLAELDQAAILLPGANPLDFLPSHGVGHFCHGLTLCLTLCM